MRCRICHAESHHPRCGDYRRCRVCGVMFVDPFPSHEVNAVFTGAEAAARLEAEDLRRLPFLRRRLDWVEQALGRDRRGARLLEIGCGAGVLLAEAVARGWRVAAVEMSPDLAERARTRVPGVEILVGDVLALEALPSGCDAVLALDVLEHVLDPAALVERCRDALAPGGVLLLQTPNTDSLRRRLEGERWDMLDARQHLTLFSRRALRDLLTARGLRVERLRTISGTGCETGLAATAAAVREAVLDRLGMGNGLVTLARRVD